MNTHTRNVKNFTIDIAQSKLDDLRRRLENINWPDDHDNTDWSYGSNKDYLQELTDYWLNDYNWREQEAIINRFNHYKTVIDDIPIHFIHQRGKGTNPTPIILTHGWPWTFWDFHQVIGPLTDPVAYGGTADESFDVVVPSLPGFGFSTPIPRSGIHWGTTADLWVKLMRDYLGYDKFAAHGGDWGSMVTAQLGHKYPQHLIGLHLTNAFPIPGFSPDRPWSMSALTIPLDATASEEAKYKALEWEKKFSAHLCAQMLSPQTLAYGMHDSPLGLAAWLIERRRSWSDCNGDVESRFSKDHLLNTVMIYWLTNSFVSSARFYQEAARFNWTPEHNDHPVVSAPTSLSLFEYDLPPSPLNWTPMFYNLSKQTIHKRGGHFGAAEEPKQVVNDIRAHFAALRATSSIS